MSIRKQHSPVFEAKGSLEVLEGEQTVTELVGLFGVHPTMIHARKKALLEGTSGVLECGGMEALRLTKNRSGTCMPRSKSWL